MKKTLLSSLILLLSVPLIGQQDAQFTQNYFNRLYPNPATAGHNDAICATVFGRQQWAGFEGAPQSLMFTGHAAFKDPWLNQSHGAGLVVISDQLGQETTMSVKLSYAYRRQIGPGTLSAGIGLGIFQKSIGNAWNSVDPAQDDFFIPDNGASDLVFDMDFGLYYQTKDLYVGLSMTHLPASVLSEQTQNAIQNPANLNYGLARHYFIIAGYEKELTADWTLKPNLFIRTDGASMSFDIGSMIEYRKKFWGGLNYRIQDAIGPMAGFNLQMPGESIAGGMLRFGYAYDVTTSGLRNHSTGSHEIMLNYCFNIVRKPKFQKHRSVRFL